ncbi:MAG: succinylglutamate desuccinylase/aspartoacylase family protein [Nonlabens sp.]
MHESLHILDREILPGSSHVLNFNMAKLYTATVVEVPVIIERGKKPGPVVLLTGGIHGDEINGVEVVRQIIAKKWNKPECGTIIAIPVLNIFGFLNNQREFPDGRDLNRMFPGTKSGPLASRFAYQIVKQILPSVDYIMDFHTGGAKRFNAPHIRIDKEEVRSLELAHIFNAPFLMYSRNLKKSFRSTCCEMGKIYLLFEGGQSSQSDKEIVLTAVRGAIRVLSHLKMLRTGVAVIPAMMHSIIIEDSKWIRAKYSGLLHPKLPYGKKVNKGDVLATITDPYGKLRYNVKAPNAGYLINVNYSPMVYQGDAIFNLSEHEEQEAT